MKQTPIYKRHIELGAKMVPFGGYEMPVQYSGINAEHEAVRNKAGLFDVSHMGEFILEGAQAELFLQHMTINDVTQIKPGQAQYSAMCNFDGGIIDDLLIYRYEDYFMLVVNAANIKKDFDWLVKHLPVGVVLNDMSQKIGLVALQGPESRNILSTLVGDKINALPYYNFIEVELGGCKVTLARTGYSGELGFEIYADSDDILSIWDILIESGRDFGLEPAGLGCRDTLRMEMKYCLYGHDIDDTTNPIEAGLSWITKFDKGDFVGKEKLLHHKDNVSRRLVCLEMVDRAIPRQGYEIQVDGKKVGIITSGTQSPSLKMGIGIAYIDIPYHKIGTEVSLDIRGSLKKAIVVKPPFYKNGTVMD